MIVLSVAHSSRSPGALSPNGKLREYDVSRRASFAASNRIVQAGHSCVVYDCGALPASDYDDAKKAFVDALKGVQLAVEIHCNANVDRAPCYSEVLHFPGSKPSEAAATTIASLLSQGLNAERAHQWRSRGPQPRSDLFFLKVKPPAVIVEGVFISNVEQAKWLAEGGQEAYGVLVAEGILQWLTSLPAPRS